MKKWVILILIAIFPLMSCNSYMTLDEVLVEKEKIDKTDNPARKLLLKNELRDQGILTRNLMEIDNLTVKDVIQSSNIDFDFCIISDMRTKKGMVELYIYTKNISRIANLEKGKTRINVTGEFGRFFTLLDEYYTKIEIVNSSIDIIDND